MQQEFLTHKTGSFSKILMGTAMIGFFGIFSPNTAVAAGEECYNIHTPHACESNHACSWISTGSSCMGESHCYGLDETSCSQTPGCYPGGPSPDMGSCVPKH